MSDPDDSWVHLGSQNRNWGLDPSEPDVMTTTMIDESFFIMCGCWAGRWVWYPKTTGSDPKFDGLSYPTAYFHTSCDGFPQVLFQKKTVVLGCSPSDRKKCDVQIQRAMIPPMVWLCLTMLWMKSWIYFYASFVGGYWNHRFGCSRDLPLSCQDDLLWECGIGPTCFWCLFLGKWWFPCNHQFW